MRRKREALFSELTGDNLQGQYKSNLYTYGLPPGMIKNNWAEKKLEEEPQEEDSCSQAMTMGFTRAAAFGGTDSEVKKIKKRQTETVHTVCESEDLWWRMIRGVLDKDKWVRH